MFEWRRPAIRQQQVAHEKLIDTLIGLVVAIGLLVAGVAILVWGAVQLKQVRASEGWPQVEGVVVKSDLELKDRETWPLVVYAYSVGEIRYTSRQISFAPFKKPGGKGLVESIVSRYPVGRKVMVYFDPAAPAVAILEPGDFAPFLMPMFFGVLFIAFGSLVSWKSFKVLVPQSTQPLKPEMTVVNLKVFAAAMSLLFYMIIVLVSFDSAVQETSIKAFGPRPAGVPNIVFILALQTLLFAPMPFVIWHAARLLLAAMRDGGTRGLYGFSFRALTMHHKYPHLYSSHVVCLAGFLYYVLIVGAWIAYTAWLGI